ncbi:MAG: hypothetical protein P8Y95_12455, partial [Gammaproteobacteria bacterium]
ERIRLGEEALAIAGRPDDLYARVEVERWLALSHQEAGNTQRVRELAVMFRGDAEQNGVLLYRYIAAGIDAFLALLEGRWEEAEGFIRKAAELGQGSGDLATEGVAGAQFMMLTRELGRLKALEPALRQFTDDPLTHPWGPAIAAVFIELGAIDEARDVFERMAKAGFANLPKDELYLTTLTFMAETCVALEDSKRAAELYQGLLPYAGQMVVQPTAVCYGPDDLYQIAALPKHLEVFVKELVALVITGGAGAKLFELRLGENRIRPGVFHHGSHVSSPAPIAEPIL